MTTPNDRDRAVARIREWAQTLPPEWRAVAEWQIQHGVIYDTDAPESLMWDDIGMREVWNWVERAIKQGDEPPPVPDWLAARIAADATTQHVDPACTPHVDGLDVRKVYVAEEPLPSVEKALEIVHGAREEEYGHPADDLRRIGLLWTTHLAGRRTPVSLDDPMTGREVCVLMMLLKSARLARTPDHADSLADVVGYVVCSDRIGNREAGR